MATAECKAQHCVLLCTDTVMLNFMNNNYFSTFWSSKVLNSSYTMTVFNIYKTVKLQQEIFFVDHKKNCLFPNKTIGKLSACSILFYTVIIKMFIIRYALFALPFPAQIRYASVLFFTFYGIFLLFLVTEAVRSKNNK